MSAAHAVEPADLSALQRPSGAFAMVAIDQREALRNMFAAHTDAPVPDAALTDFKLEAARALSPHASAMLVDRQFAWEQVVAEQVVHPECGLIASADHFEAAHGEVVGRVTIDRDVDPEAVRAQGAVALKLLVLYRPDGGGAERVAMVEEFVQMCHSAGLTSIVEPVSRPPLGGGDWDWDAGVLAAAEELGSLGTDLYKAEVPLHGEGPAAEVARGCEQITATVDSPWVVLSSGVREEVFPSAVETACRAGASGFLAGRAVWASCIGKPDVAHELRTAAVDRLRRLGDLVDDVVGR